MEVFLKDLAPPTTCPPDACRVMDTLTDTVVTITEWISNEYYRIQNDVRPRHCESYEQLTEIIMNTRLLEPLRVAPPPLPILSDQEIFSGEDCDNEDDDNNNDDDEQDECEEEEYENEGSQEENQEERDETIHKDIPVDTAAAANTINNKIMSTSCNKINNTHIKSYNLLCRVFVEVILYCSKAGTTMNAPGLFLDEFEKLFREVKSGNTVNAVEFRENLLKILLGKIKMTEQLVKSWMLACEWVMNAPLNNQKNALHWIEISLNAYIAAQRIVIGRHLIMRQCLQEQMRRNPYLKLSSDIAICKK